jgi:hypothetical protein
MINKESPTNLARKKKFDNLVGFMVDFPWNHSKSLTGSKFFTGLTALLFVGDRMVAWMTTKLRLFFSSER